MENSTSDSPVSVNIRRVPKAAWVLLAGLVAALVAIFVFKVAASTVISFGLFGLMMFGHLFMHGGHGSHGAQPEQINSQEAGIANPGQKDSHSGHGGCH